MSCRCEIAAPTEPEAKAAKWAPGTPQNMPSVLWKTIEVLQQAWPLLSRSRPHFESVTWTREGLQFGAGTLVAKTVVGEEARLLALLSIATKRAVPPSVIGRIQHSEREFQAGNLAKSAMHIALANLPALARPEDAYRLYIAAALVDEGFVTPTELMKAADIDPTYVEALRKYSPDQPRAPAGDTGGGRWIREGEVAPPAVGRKQRAKPIQSAIVLPEGCEKEWADAIAYCIELLDMPDPQRGLTGGHTTVHGCAKGFVSARCRGNPVT